MYAMTKVSRRGRGHAVACDLVKATLRGANRLSAVRHNEAVYARLAEDFGGYLVTDSEPMTEAEILATDGGRHCAPGFAAFSDRRAAHAWGVMSMFCTSPETGGRGVGLHCVDVGSYPIDAPGRMAAGAMLTNGFDDWPATFRRGDE